MNLNNSKMKKLFDAKKEIPVIKKDANNPFFKSGYATLSNIIETVDPILTKNGLMLTHSMQEKALVTQIWDGDRVILESKFDLPINGDIQKIGSAITYAKRYNITAMLNLNIEDDDDGNATKPKPEYKVKVTADKTKESTAYTSALKAVNEATDLIMMRDRINESIKLTSVEKDSLHKIINERIKK